MVNGTDVGRSYEFAASGTPQSSANMVIVEVKAKQHVWVQTNSADFYFHSHSSFAGYLLHR